ncbi:MAG: hypothetical protein ACK6D0_03780 [Planctomyces sp.]|jgi:hypothetical protein
MNDVGVDSPFAPPSTDDRGLQVDRPATWFQLEDTVVVCGRELRLPAYCLVSGESVSLSEPLQLKVVAGTAWSASLLAAILLGVIAMAFGGWLAGSALQNLGVTNLWIGGSLFAIGGAFLVGSLVLTARQTFVQVTAGLTPDRFFWKNCLELWPATILLFIPGMQSDNAAIWGGAALPVELAAFVFYRWMLRGTFLKARQRESGLFVLSGFSEVYLTRLRSVANAYPANTAENS